MLGMADPLASGTSARKGICAINVAFHRPRAPGITRKRIGRAWGYFDAKGKRLTDRDEIDRLNAIALPPAYADAWFCPDPNGHMQATGIDARGRKQYRYHPEYRAKRKPTNMPAAANSGRHCPRFAAASRRTSKRKAGQAIRVLAAVVRLLDGEQIRVGNRAICAGQQELRRDHASLRAM